MRAVDRLDFSTKLPNLFDDDPNRIKPLKTQGHQITPVRHYSTVTLFAKFRGWSTLQPRNTATW